MEQPGELSGAAALPSIGTPTYAASSSSDGLANKLSPKREYEEPASLEYPQDGSPKLEECDRDLPFLPNGQAQHRSATPQSSTSQESADIPGVMLALVAVQEAQILAKNAKDAGVPHTFTILGCDGEFCLTVTSDHQEHIDNILDRVAVSFRCPKTDSLTHDNATLAHPFEGTSGDADIPVTISGSFGLALSLFLRCECHEGL